MLSLLFPPVLPHTKMSPLFASVFVSASVAPVAGASNLKVKVSGLGFGKSKFQYILFYFQDNFVRKNSKAILRM